MVRSLLGWLGMIAMAGTIVMWCLFAVEIVVGLMAKLVHRWQRDVGRAHPALVVPVVYAPMLSAVAAIAAGMGVNLYTAAGDDVAVGIRGIAALVLALGMMAAGCAALLQYSLKGPGGLDRIRQKLGQYGDLRQPSSDLTQAIAWCLRVERVGRRLEARAAELTWRRWFRRFSLVTTAAMGTFLSNAVLLAFVLLASVLSGALPQEPWLLLGVPGSGTVLAPIVVAMQRGRQRAWLRSRGQELIDEASTLRKALEQRQQALAPGMREQLRRWWKDVKNFPRPSTRAPATITSRCRRR